MPTSLVLARLGEFFGHRTPWHRRLWNVGTNLALHEVIEYADACLSGAVPNTEGLRYVIGTVKRQIHRDPAVAPLACEITSCLDALNVSSRSKIPVVARDELEQLVRRLASDYLDNWRSATIDPPVEFSARALASHLLDLGYSPDHLHRWITAMAPTIMSMDQLIEFRLEAGQLMVFDNQRILHGRSEYDHGRRHLQGCYADKDAVRSRIRVLEDA